MIPFNKPGLAGNEMQYVSEAIANGHAAGGGPFTRRCEALLGEILGARTLLTTSCTHALEMAALLLNICPGDEVIVPSFTFVSTANAFALRGARIIFCDVRLETLNVDESKIEALITPRTRAIVFVNYGGVACKVGWLREISIRQGIPLVEDNAHGLLGSYCGTPLGTFGDLATLSFHETKNLTCGEGGALIVNNPEYAERAEILRDKGTNRGRFSRGDVGKYTWVDLGSSYVMSDMLAAFLLAQLEGREEIKEARKQIWDRYSTNLIDWAFANGVDLPSVPFGCEQSYHLFYMLMPSREDRDALIAHLAASGVRAVFHYVPLRSSPMGLKYGGDECPVSEYVSERIIRLPFFNDLSGGQQRKIVETIQEFKCASRIRRTSPSTCLA